MVVVAEMRTRRGRRVRGFERVASPTRRGVGVERAESREVDPGGERVRVGGRRGGVQADAGVAHEVRRARRFEADEAV